MPVPLDDDHPRGRQISIAVIRSHAADPTRRIGSVVFNPGGPGGAGTIDLPGLFASFPSEIRNRFDLVSFDPRGIGQSTAVQCFDTSADESAFLAHAPAAFPVGTREEKQWIRTYRGFSEKCEQRNGDLLEHISTADAARDMDQLRGAAAPILVVGNRHDPQTPYSDSLAMVRWLRRARLLTVEGFGHTAMLNPSDCANSAIVAYLVDGRLPPNGTVCPQTVQPFAG